MACTRGCTGVSICNGSICCIQFQQDCGTDCVGIAEGFSRIQFNADGELVVCSNVGGVCTCASLGDGTVEDTFVDNGDGSITHTSNEGTAVTVDICDLLQYCSIDDLGDVGLAVPVAGQVLGYNGAGWTNVDVAASIDVCAIVAADCDSTVVDNGNGSFTHNSPGGVATVIDICNMVADGGCTDTLTVVGSAVTHTALDGVVSAFDICTIVGDNCDPTLAHAGGGILQFTSVAGTITNIDLCAVIAAECLAAITDTMVDNGDGTATHTAVDGTIVTLDVCQMIIDGACSDTLVNNADGTYTHTAVDGVATVITICDALAVTDTDCIDLTLTATGTGCAISAEPIVSAQDCNGFECLADGMYVNNDFGCVQAVDAFGGVQFANGTGFPAGVTQQGPTASVTITNNSLCNNMSGVAIIGGAQLQYITSGAMAGNSRIRLRVEFSPDGGGTWLSNAINDTHITAVPNETGQLNLSGLTFTLNNLPPGASQNVLVRAFVEDLDGNFLGDASVTTTSLRGEACLSLT